MTQRPKLLDLPAMAHGAQGAYGSEIAGHRWWIWDQWSKLSDTPIYVYVYNIYIYDYDGDGDGDDDDGDGAGAGDGDGDGDADADDDDDWWWFMPCYANAHV